MRVPLSLGTELTTMFYAPEAPAPIYSWLPHRSDIAAVIYTPDRDGKTRFSTLAVADIDGPLNGKNGFQLFYQSIMRECAVMVQLRTGRFAVRRPSSVHSS
jgi:hypothetical protein